MPEISLITSLYRSEEHLPRYHQLVESMLRRAKIAELSLEFVVVANDPTKAEQNLLHEFSEQQPHVRLIEVPRETLYASWNRGVAQAQADIFGFWNVDDVRSLTALSMARAAFAVGADVVDFPFEVITRRRALMTFTTQRYTRRPMFNHDLLTRKSTFGTFFLTNKTTYERLGPFDENFRIAGDLDWTARAMGNIAYHLLSQPGGTFVLHGKNLSNQSNARELIEANIVLMRRAAWHDVRPTPLPESMRISWEAWGNPQGIEVPHHIADLLWGPDAIQHWNEWVAVRRRLRRSNRVRAVPRMVIKRLGIRPVLARLGIVKPDR